MNYLIFISAIVGGMLLYLLSGSSINTEVFSASYYGLLEADRLARTGLMGLWATSFGGCREQAEEQGVRRQTYLAPGAFHDDRGVAGHPGLCGVGAISGQEHRIVV